MIRLDFHGVLFDMTQLRDVFAWERNGIYAIHVHQKKNISFISNILSLSQFKRVFVYLFLSVYLLHYLSLYLYSLFFTFFVKFLCVQ